MCLCVFHPYLCAVDNHCVKLVHEYNAVEPLIHVVRKATDLKASHAATGVLRNLALAGKHLLFYSFEQRVRCFVPKYLFFVLMILYLERNRELMGNAGVIQACFPLLKKDNALPLQANVVGILKRLSTNDGHNTIRIISGREPFETLSSTPNTEGDIETPMSTLVDVIGRSDDFALKSEGTRTLCNLVKVIWGSEGMREFDTRSITALQQTLNKADVVLPIAAMTRNPKYVVLQNEGVIALTLLVTSPSQGKPIIQLLFVPFALLEPRSSVLLNMNYLLTAVFLKIFNFWLESFRQECGAGLAGVGRVNAPTRPGDNHLRRTSRSNQTPHPPRKSPQSYQEPGWKMP